MMFLPLLLAHAVDTSTRPLPTLPPLVSAEYQATVAKVADQLERGDFKSAAKSVDLLPKPIIRLEWDDRKVPAKDREAYITARNEALRSWSDFSQGKVYLVKQVPGAVAQPVDLRISFEPELAVDPILSSKARTAVFVQDSLPRIDGRIALQRGNPFRSASPLAVRNDVLNIVGAYFGVSRNIVTYAAMTPSDQLDEVANGITQPEIVAMRVNLLVANALRDASQKKTHVKFRAGVAAVTPLSFTGDVVQGDKVEMELKLGNAGDGPLAFRVVGDCSCVLVGASSVVGPRESSTVKVSLDTKEFDNRVERRLTVFTSDPRMPVQYIPVSLKVKPLFRFLSPSGRAMLMPEGGLTSDVYLTFTEGNEFEVVGARLNGVQGKVTFEKWQGQLADPDRGEGMMPRKGYRIHLSVPNTLVTGRAMLGLQVATTQEDFPQMNFPMTLQKGIVASPEEIFVGDLGKVAKEISFQVTRPQVPFKLLSATIDAKSISVKFEAGKAPGEYKVTLRYDGTAPAGDLSATVTLKTDDPKQPQVLVPITGTIR